VRNCQRNRTASVPPNCGGTCGSPAKRTAGRSAPPNYGGTLRPAEQRRDLRQPCQTDGRTLRSPAELRRDLWQPSLTAAGPAAVSCVPLQEAMSLAYLCKRHRGRALPDHHRSTVKATALLGSLQCYLSALVYPAVLCHLRDPHDGSSSITSKRSLTAVSASILRYAR
jgi:hypothetical protein